MSDSRGKGVCGCRAWSVHDEPNRAAAADRDQHNILIHRNTVKVQLLLDIGTEQAVGDCVYAAACRDRADVRGQKTTVATLDGRAGRAAGQLGEVGSRNNRTRVAS